ncbi:MAG: hypothetical protein LBS19_13340 [Clostridiales bacterium]|jgi:hypothetical protein|nr:hypothetical protein [Clostridiales bacterium]
MKATKRHLKLFATVIAWTLTLALALCAMPVSAFDESKPPDGGIIVTGLFKEAADETQNGPEDTDDPEETQDIAQDDTGSLPSSSRT